MDLAIKFGSLSKDSTKVGAIVLDNDYRILAYGYNGFPRGYPDDYNIPRETKLLLTVHAELNAILNAASNGVSCSGMKIICTHHPCSNCAACLVNAGVSEVIIPNKNRLSSEWSSSNSIAYSIFEKCNIKVTSV
jgi:dCMP deaminase